MMPFDVWSGFDDAPTMAMTVASVSSCFSSASDGFAWAIVRAYNRSAVRQSPEQADDRRGRGELTDPEEERPAHELGAPLAQIGADLRQSLGDRDAEAGVHSCHLLSHFGSDHRKTSVETFRRCRQHRALHLLEGVAEVVHGVRSELVVKTESKVRLHCTHSRGLCGA